MAQRVSKARKHKKIKRKNKKKAKSRPPRLYYDAKQNKYYIMKNRKRVYVAGENMSQQQIVNVIVDNFRTRKKKGQKRKGKITGLPLLDRGSAYSGPGNKKWSLNEAKYFAKVYADNLGKVANAQLLGIEGAKKDKDDKDDKDDKVSKDDIQRLLDAYQQQQNEFFQEQSKRKRKKITYFDLDKNNQTAYIDGVEDLDAIEKGSTDLHIKVGSDKYKLNFEEAQELANEGEILLDSGVTVQVDETEKANLKSGLRTISKKARDTRKATYTHEGHTYKTGEQMKRHLTTRYKETDNRKNVKPIPAKIPKHKILDMLEELDKAEKKPKKKEEGKKEYPEKPAQGPPKWSFQGKKYSRSEILELAKKMDIKGLKRTIKEIIDDMNKKVKSSDVDSVLVKPEKRKSSPEKTPAPKSKKTIKTPSTKDVILDMTGDRAKGVKYNYDDGEPEFSDVTADKNAGNEADEEPDEEIDEEGDEEADEEDPVSGDGQRLARNSPSMTKGKGLYDYQLEQIMKKYPAFSGVYSMDELLKIPARKKFGVILNLDESHKPGSHWIALYIDSIDDKSIEYYDSFAREPPKRLLKDLKKLVEKIDPHYYLKLKVNKIKQQSSDSSDCGFFAMKFLIDRFHGKQFKEASGFSEIRKSEKKIKKFKQQLGFGSYL